MPNTSMMASNLPMYALSPVGADMNPNWAPMASSHPTHASVGKVVRRITTATAATPSRLVPSQYLHPASAIVQVKVAEGWDGWDG